MAGAPDALPVLLPMRLGTPNRQLDEVHADTFERILPGGQDVRAVLDGRARVLRGLIERAGALRGARCPVRGPCPVTRGAERAGPMPRLPPHLRLLPATALLAVFVLSPFGPIAIDGATVTGDGRPGTFARMGAHRQLGTAFRDTMPPAALVVPAALARAPAMAGIVTKLRRGGSAILAISAVPLGIPDPADGRIRLAGLGSPGTEAFRRRVAITRALPLPLPARPLAVMVIRAGPDDGIIGLAPLHPALAPLFAVPIARPLVSGIPADVEEAASTPGCTRPRAFAPGVLPPAAPGIAASAVSAFPISRTEMFAGAVPTIENRTLTAVLMPSPDRSPLHPGFAGAAAPVLPALIRIFAVRRYPFAVWGIVKRRRADMAEIALRGVR